MIVGLGVDLVEIERMQRMLDRKYDRVMRRLFTEREAEYAAQRSNPAMHLAARVAAKEAAYKALSGSESARAVGWKEIEVVRGWEGPTLELHGLAARRAAELGVTRIHLSMTHTERTAGAVVILERE
jgi:holo-[acyl-carrier protein] synthase